MVLRTIQHYRGVSVSVVLGTAVACAVLAGALLVGTSVRGSLRAIALGRIGSFRVSVEAGVAKPAGGALAAVGGMGESVARLLRLDVSAVSKKSGSRAADVRLNAVDGEFWRVYGLSDGPSPGSVWVNEALARELGIGAGDDLIVNMPVHSPIPSESLIGRRDGRVRKWRARVGRVLPDSGVGGFDVTFRQTPRLNIFADLAEVQTSSRHGARVNLCLSTSNAADALVSVRSAIRAGLTLEDAGLRIRASNTPGGPAFVIESESLVIPRALEDAAVGVATELDARVERVLTHLANTIRRVGDDAASIPYSVVAATDLEFESTLETAPDGVHPSAAESPPDAAESLSRARGEGIGAISRLAERADAVADRIYLNDWAASRIGARPGDVIELEYYMLNPGGALRTERRTLPLASVVKLSGEAADVAFTPEYPGISNARRMGDWDPPFPVDFKRIGRDDEEYWDRHRATPKAFVPLSTGQQWWADEREPGARFGRVTSIRVYGDPASRGSDAARSRPATSIRSPEELERAFVARLMTRIDAESVGIMARDLRAEGEAAARGTTDFGGLFVGFSMFLIAAAALLAGLMFRLNVEHRAPQIGLFLAMGWSAGDVWRLLVREGVLLAAMGALLGAPAAMGYAWLMIAGLRTLWQSAVGTTELRLFVSIADIAIGAAIGFLVACVSLAWAVRGIGRRSPAALLVGRVDTWESDTRRIDRRNRRGSVISLSFGVISTACVAASFVAAHSGRAALFFAAGASALIALLTAFAEGLKRNSRSAAGAAGPEAMGLWRLGVRQSARRPDRTIASVCMIASATFVVIAVAASRHEPRIRLDDRRAGHGGFALYGHSAAPLMADPGIRAGRDALGIDVTTEASLGVAQIIALRYRSGDDASCLNLYKPHSPAIVGVPEAMIERGGFSFASSIASIAEERRNPWLLLNKTFDDGAVPVFGDASTVTWMLKLGLGDDLILLGDDGREARLRIVGTLAGSIFQSELVTSERQFLRVFPRTEGYRAMLVEMSANRADASRTIGSQATEDHVLSVSDTLERQLADFGLDLSPTVKRLAAFARVENTYLSTFQVLGGLGLLLGTLGVAALTLRTVLERRGEMALLSAVGLTRTDIGRLMLAEAGFAIVFGVSIGTACALLAVAPNAMTSAREIPWGSMAALMVGVAATGLAGAAAAVAMSTRGRRIDALRSA